MRSPYKISLAVLALGFLAVAGSALAQDDKPPFTLTGDVGAALGSFTFDKSQTSPSAANTSSNTTACGGADFTTTCDRANAKGFTELAASWESNLRFTWKKDDFQVINRYRIRGSNEQSGQTAGVNGFNNNTTQSGSALSSSSNDVYIEAWWTPGDFRLGVGRFQGPAWSQPFSGTYQIVNPLPGSDVEYSWNWTGIPGLDAEYNLGVAQVGVAFSSQCRPGCNAVPNNSTSRAVVSGSTVTPHLAGKAGDIAFRAQAPQTSAQFNNTADSSPITGKAANGTKVVTGSGYAVGVQWAQGGLKVGLDVAGFTESKVSEFKATQGSAPTCSKEPVPVLPDVPGTFPAQCKDRVRSLTSLRLDLPAGPGSAMLGYASLDDNNYGQFTYTTTVATLRYYYPTSFGNVIPEYRASTVGGGQAVAAVPVVAGTPNTATGNALNTKAKDTSNSEIRLILQGTF
jgi:hypothetical protein